MNTVVLSRADCIRMLERAVSRMMGGEWKAANVPDLSSVTFERQERHISHAIDWGAEDSHAIKITGELDATFGRTNPNRATDR